MFSISTINNKAVLQAYEALAAQLPSGLTLAEMKAFRKAGQEAAEAALVAGAGAGGAGDMVADAKAAVRVALIADDGIAQLHLNTILLMLEDVCPDAVEVEAEAKPADAVTAKPAATAPRATFEVPAPAVAQAPAFELTIQEAAPAPEAPAPVELGYSLKAGHGVAPTAFVRSGLFGGTTDSLLTVLGMKNVVVEREGEALTATHLQVMTYLLSLVRSFDADLGAAVKFGAWEAVKTLGWTKATQSLARLRDAIDALAATTIRVIDGINKQEAAPLVALRRTSLDARDEWTVQLPATLLAHLRHRTFLALDTLAALPAGAATWLYSFVQSERSNESEWDVSDLAEAAGLTSSNPYEISRKLKTALETLKAGAVETKARGAGGVVVKKFRPVLKSFQFRKTADGKQRVSLVKA